MAMIMRGFMLELRTRLRMVSPVLSGLRLQRRITPSMRRPETITTAGTLGVRRTESSAMSIKLIQDSVLSGHAVKYDNFNLHISFSVVLWDRSQCTIKNNPFFIESVTVNARMMNRDDEYIYERIPPLGSNTK